MSFPRLLPITIAVMALLLVVKSTALVRAASEHPAEGAPAAHGAPEHAAVGEAKAPPEAKTAAAEPPPPPVVLPPQEPPVSDGERALLLDLRHRRGELDAREAALAAREAMLAAADKRLTARVDQLTALQSRLETLDKARRDRDDANWAGLTKLYEQMKPRDAATIFNDLDMPVLLQVLDRMKEAKAAPVLAAMLPDRARLVTAQLAQLRGRANTVPAAATASGG